MRRVISLSPAGAFGAALVPALALAAFVLVDIVHDNPTLFRAFDGAALALGAWNVALFAASRRGGQRRTLEIAPRAQHHVEACAQASVLLYWGWHWAPVYDAVPLIAGQLVFAYGFDLLLGWSRRDAHRLGFGPVPVIFSINLFLWFTDDWFHFQFLLVAIGFAAKELIRWKRDGRLVHIFNPASFPLAVFALALIVTGMSDVTRAQDIAISQFYPPQMYLWIFLIALPGQYLFGVTTMTMAAVVSTYLFGLLYLAATGRTVRGAGPGWGADVLRQAAAGAVAEPVGDRDRPGGAFGCLPAVRSGGAPALADAAAAALGVHWGVGRRAAISAVRGVGDRHPGQWVPFWQQACEDGRPHACGFLVAQQSRLCNMGSGCAWNQAGVLQAGLGGAGGVGDEREGGGQAEALFAFQRGCELGFEAACGNYRAMLGGRVSLSAHGPHSTTIRSSSGAARGKSPTGSPRSCTPGPAGKGAGRLRGCQEMIRSSAGGAGTRIAEYPAAVRVTVDRTDGR